jgi:hypothetical protein
MTTENRSGYTAGLRQLADVLDAHPEIPLPDRGTDEIGALYIGFWGEDAKERLAAAARAFPCNWAKSATDRFFNLNGQLAGLHVELTATRSQVCTAVVTGVEDREVEEVVTPAVTRKVTKRVEVVEWECLPLLAADASDVVESAIEADPDGVADAVSATLAEDDEDEPAPLHCGAVCKHDCTCSLPEGHDGDHETRGSGGQELCSWPQDVQVCFWCGIEGTGMKQISVVPEGLRWECADAEACRHGNPAYAAPDTAQHSCEVCRVPVTGGEIGPDGVTWLCEDHRADPAYAPDTAQPEDIPEPTSLADALKASLAAAQPEDSPVPSPCYWCGTTEGDLVTFASTDDGSESRFCKDVDACYTRKPSPGGRTCPDCGAVGLPVRDAESHCYNRDRCAERQAAKASTR